MKVLIVLGHPNSGKSFNRAIAERVSEGLQCSGYEPVIRDLYAMKFEPIFEFGEEKKDFPQLSPSLNAEIDLVREAAGLVFIHPNWWGGPPAILKGWIDRVFRAGFAYRFTPDGVVPSFTDKTALVFSTSNTPREIEENVYHNPIENFWKNIVFGLVGAKSFAYRNFESIIMSSEEERAAWLTEVDKMVKTQFPKIE